MTQKSKNKANEPLSEYGQPATFEQVWKMFQETNKQFHETDRQFKKTEKQFKETGRRIDKMAKYYDGRIDKLAELYGGRIDKLAKLYGGVSDNSREFAEEFFKRGLEARDSIFGIKYDQVDRLERKTKKLQGEYDIVLHNGEYIIVIEVKYKLHPDDVDDFINRKLRNFKPLFKEYADKKIIGAVAAMSIPKHSYEAARENGLLVLAQSGDNISVMNPENFVLKEY